jgi:hypothetical protein
MKHQRQLAVSLTVCVAVASISLLIAAPAARAQMTDVLTYHNDNARTGQALHEEILAPANVNTNHFGKLWVLAADGKVDAQPLYAAGILIPGKGVHNVLVVATEHDSVYAFDADATNMLWSVSLLGSGESPSDNRGCSQVTPEIGITATPVIDRQLGSNGTVFVVAMSKNGSTYFQRLHALDLATGADRVAAETVTASYPGTGDNSNGGNVIFDPAKYKERPGLLLLNGVIYTAWSSHCDARPYTGWIMGYTEQTLTQTNVLNVTPNGNEGAIWMAGDGLAADADGNIYFLDANGFFDTSFTASGFPANSDYGNAFIKLSTTANTLAVADYFTMSNAGTENSTDEDLGSGGELVLPDMLDAQNNTRHLAVGAGKDQIIYLVDRTNMGKFSSTTNAIYQQVNGVLAGMVFSTPAYFITALSATISKRCHSKMPDWLPYHRKHPALSGSPVQRQAFRPTAHPTALCGLRKTTRRLSCMPMTPPISPTNCTTAAKLQAAATTLASATSSSPRRSPVRAFMSARRMASASSACSTSPR